MGKACGRLASNLVQTSPKRQRRRESSISILPHQQRCTNLDTPTTKLAWPPPTTSPTPRTRLRPPQPLALWRASGSGRFREFREFREVGGVLFGACNPHRHFPGLEFWPLIRNVATVLLTGGPTQACFHVQGNLPELQRTRPELNQTAKHRKTLQTHPNVTDLVPPAASRCMPRYPKLAAQTPLSTRHQRSVAVLVCWHRAGPGFQNALCQSGRYGPCEP